MSISDIATAQTLERDTDTIVHTYNVYNVYNIYNVER